MLSTDRAAGVLRVRRPGTRWLHAGHGGGFRRADAAHVAAVETGFDRTDLDAYVRERLAAAGFEDGPTLLTAVALDHARGARCGPVAAVVTAGLSNPATLPMDPDGRDAGVEADPSPDAARSPDDRPRPGTINVVLVTDRALDDGTLASLLASAVEAKTATALAETGFTGTTSDALVVGCDPGGDPADFAGSATDLGTAARACVREAMRASLRSRYAGEGSGRNDDPPESVAEAEYGRATTRRATVFEV